MADVYVMPSVSEPFGIAPLEAMALDVPVIVSRQSGVVRGPAARAQGRLLGRATTSPNKILAAAAPPRAARAALVEAGREEVRPDALGRCAAKHLRDVYQEVGGVTDRSSSTSRCTSRSGCGATPSSTSARSDDYFDDAENARIVRRVAEKCYLPMNALLLRADRAPPAARFRCAFSISGTALEQMERWAPEALESFAARWRATGCVEFLAETSHHSLASSFDPEEFERAGRARTPRRIERALRRATDHVPQHRAGVLDDAHRAPRRGASGFACILGEGADHLLGWRSPHRVYRPEGCERIKLLLRSYQLSDDIAFRFSNRGWDAVAAHADKFAQLGARRCRRRTTCRRPVHGLRDLRRAPVGATPGSSTSWSTCRGEVLRRAACASGRRREVAAERRSRSARLDIPHPVSWADAERDLTAWLGNEMQRAANDALVRDRPRGALRPADTDAARATGGELTTSDHLYYMCTKWFSDGDVHKYFSPYASPHDAFIAFMNVLDDVDRRARRQVRRDTQETFAEPLPMAAAPAAG